MTTIVGQQNVLSYTWSVTTGTGTLVISNNTYFDLGLTDIVRIANTTHAAIFTITPGTTFSNTFVSGKPTYTWVIPNVPATTVTDDTLLIYINVTPPQLTNLLLQYQKA